MTKEEKEIEWLREHINSLNEMIEGWQKVAQDKDEIIEEYRKMIN